MPKKQHDDGHGGGGMERWLLTYADLITLLLIFFIIMYSMSSLNKAKFDQLVQMLSMSFGGQRSIVAQYNNGVLEKNFMPSQVRTKEQKKLYVKTVSALQKEIQNKEVRITADKRGIVVSLSSDCFFTSGSADLSDSMSGVLTKLNDIFQTLPNDIRIEGHTDDVPIAPGSALAQRFPTNWELSSQRAVNVLKVFEKLGLDKARMSASAYADSRPVKPNDTEESRALNRRVEIVILNTPTIEKLTDLDKPQEPL
jgi:chemotaxis protein MotB